ncbi:hypothetical protein ACSVCE_22395 [Chromobacterium haemolyticum]|uniref:hypothetical protein n=1 Tax=Chromobacterium TaxID=535 RepID=UPI001374F336|nr:MULTISPECIES: hypothetical protein [Chromobacterium]MDH0341550.1 hypothetical protein [Chromobacterium haemolyticum]
MSISLAPVQPAPSAAGRRLTLLLCCLAALALIVMLTKSIPAAVVRGNLPHEGGDPDSVIVQQGRLPRTVGLTVDYRLLIPS